MCWAACRDETTSLVTSSLRRPLLKPLPLPATMCVVLRIWLHLLHASNLFVFAVADSQSHATLRLQVAAEIITSPRPQLAGCCFWWSLFVTVFVKPNAQQKTRVELMAIINRWRLTFLVQFELYTVSKNAPTLACCSFDNHGLIWYFFGKRHQHTFKMICVFNCPYPFTFPPEFLLTGTAENLFKFYFHR